MTARPGVFSRLGHRLLHRVWYVHPAVVLTVQASPAVCLQTLAVSAKPSQDRLHLRDLFRDGRRYYLQPSKEGFQLTSNSRVPWRRGRTGITAVMSGTFSDGGSDATRLLLRARISIPYLLNTFFVPLFVSSIIVFAHWSPLVIAASILALFSLSWLGHRLNATLQAGEMVFFVQKALEDLAPATIPQLPADTQATITMDREFREQWQKFYEEHKEGD